VRFLPNDPILIFQNGYKIYGKFIEQNEKTIIIDLDNHGKVVLDKSYSIIELNYKEKLFRYLERVNQDNNYFKELYNYIIPKF
jgi:hypothetical protein